MRARPCSEIEIATPALLVPGHTGVAFPVAEPDGSGTAFSADNASHAPHRASTSGSATGDVSSSVLLGALVAIGVEAVVAIVLLVAWRLTT